MFTCLASSRSSSLKPLFLFFVDERMTVESELEEAGDANGSDVEAGDADGSGNIDDSANKLMCRSKNEITIQIGTFYTH